MENANAANPAMHSFVEISPGITAYTMDTKAIWITYKTQLYFFIRKRVDHREDAEEILQNTFVKIHQNLHKLRHPEKVRSWAFQIARNEWADYVTKRPKTAELANWETAPEYEPYSGLCCFEACIEELPGKYKQAVHLVYFEGKSQKQASETLAISLANVKAKIRRAKQWLINYLSACCGYELSANGKLVGEPSCVPCATKDSCSGKVEQLKSVGTKQRS